MDENEFSGVKSISEHIESYSKIKNTPKKFHKKLTVRGGRGVNAYGQPDRKISAFFFTTPITFPYYKGKHGTVKAV